jgi:plastocyanin
MSQQIINTNKGTADSLKTGATKINSNFTELYTILSNNPVAIPALLGNSGKYLTTDGTAVSWQTFQVPDAVVTTGSYANPSWITSLNYSKLTNTPNLAIYLTAGSLSVNTITPSGTGALNYSNGIFTYTPPNLAAVATSGSYADLTNKPTITEIPTQAANSGKYLTTDGTTLSWAVVTGGTTDYNNLTNKPTIPAAQVQSDWNAVSGLGVVLNKPSLFSGSYTDLTNKPTIPAAQVQSDWNAVSGLGVVLNKPSLFSGSYTDLTNQPTIPAAYSATSINALSDVDTVTTTPTAGQPLVWNAVSSSWVPGSVISGSLSTLTGVTITSPAVGQVLKYNGTSWINDADSVSGGAGVGTVTSVSVVSTNGFTGTVATASSTPAITITTSITGVLKGNGTAILAATSGTDYAPGTSSLSTGIVKSTTTTGALSIAVAGTDYQAPIGTITGLVKGNGANALTAAVAGTDYQSAQSVTGIVKSSGTTRSAATSGTDYAPGTSALATGIVKSTTTTGALSIAVAGTDYQAPVSATGILKSNGTSGNVSAATAGTDYQAPIGTISGLVKGNGANTLTAAVAGTDYQSAQSVNGIVKSSGTTRSAAVAGTDYIAPYSSQAANTHLAAPSGAAGAPTFRLLTSADIPSTLGTTAHSGTVTLNASANLIFTGSSSGTITFVAGVSPANQSYTLPSAFPGVTGYVLSSTTGGVLSWVGAAAGTVTSVSVASANGFTGTVANSTSTPAITITTSITGVLKGNGTSISAATAGTDYQAPIGTISGLVKGNGANALTAATAGTDYQAPIGTITGLVKGNGANALTAATANIDYQSAQSVSGIVKSSGTTRSAAIAGTDYQAPISLTTIGSSGVATFTNNTLNIPQYAGGASSFSVLSDASSASLTVDEIYLPAITMLAVTNNGATAYRFDQYGMADDPTIYAISGTTIAFNLSVTGHPFLIRTSGGVNYNDGLVHVSIAGVVSTGASAQGQVAGTLYWKIPAGTTGNYQYICSIHSGMVGVITIKDISAI